MFYKDFATNYQKIDKIGEGSYGEVYLCQRKLSAPKKEISESLDENNHPNVLKTQQILQKKESGLNQIPSYCALKKLKMRVNKPYSYSSEDSPPKVQDLRQVQILKCLNHQNLMKFQQIVFQDKGYTQNYYLVLPFGIEVLQFAKHKEVILTKSLRKTVFYQIVKGLKEIHSQGILHRDIKPDNIFLMRNGLIKIGDFSLSIHKLDKKGNHSIMVEQSQEEQKLSGNVTTRYYRAPQIMYGSRHYNEKIDIWSLGCTLAELILHQPIFPGQTDINQLELIFKAIGYPQQYWPAASQLPYYLEFVQQHEETKLQNILPDVEPQLLDLIGKCLQLDPKKRIPAQQLLQHQYFGNVVEKSEELQKLAVYLHDKKIKDILKKHL